MLKTQVCGWPKRGRASGSGRPQASDAQDSVPMNLCQMGVLQSYKCKQKSSIASVIR
jgi:hypothetical protein